MRPQTREGFNRGIESILALHTHTHTRWCKGRTCKQTNTASVVHRQVKAVCLCAQSVQLRCPWASEVMAPEWLYLCDDGAQSISCRCWPWLHIPVSVGNSVLLCETSKDDKLKEVQVLDLCLSWCLQVILFDQHGNAGWLHSFKKLRK